MDSAKQAVADLQASRAKTLDDEIRRAAFHCIHNSGPINEILKAVQWPSSTPFRIMDENRVRAVIEQSAAALAQDRVQLNLRTQERMGQQVKYLQNQIKEYQGQIKEYQGLLEDSTTKIIELENTLEAKDNELANLTQEFTRDLTKGLGLTPQGTPSKNWQGQESYAAVVGDGKLFGDKDLKQHKKLKY